MAKTTIKVGLPLGKPAQIIKLIENILKQHDQLEAATPGSSPAHPARITKLRAVLAAAKPDRENAKHLAAQSKQLFERSNQAIGLAAGQTQRTEGTGLNLSALIRDGLLNEYAGNENALEVWGFSVVVGTAARPKKKAGPPPPA